MTVPNEPEGPEEKLSPGAGRSAGKIGDAERRREIVVVARRATREHAPPLKDVKQPRTERQSRAERREWIVPLTILVVGLAAAVFGIQRTGTPSAESTWEPSAMTTTTTMSEAEKAAAKAKRYQAWGKKPSVSGSKAGGGADTSVADELAGMGVSDSLVQEVSIHGDMNGFLFDTRTPTWSERLDFAYMSYLECEAVAAGETTWQAVRDESIATGASSGEATAMTNYWEHNFCPAITGTEPDPQ